MLKVSDSLSNANDQIGRAAKIIGRSKDKALVFRAVYHGKGVKTVEKVMAFTRMGRKRVLEDAAKLSNQHLFTRRHVDGQVLYEPDSFIQANKNQILSLAGNPQKLKRLSTKTNPSASGSAQTITLRLPKRRVRVTHVTIDDIDSFALVKKVALAVEKLTGMSEKKFKEGVQAVIGEKGEFTDWGGEKNDLLSTRLIYKGRRRRVAFAFKGPGKGGTLVPGKMGKNGDQLQRLFDSTADFYLVQHWNRIAESVPELMELIASTTSFREDREIFYGIVDGADSARLVVAYPKQFGGATTKGAKRGNKKRQ